MEAPEYIPKYLKNHKMVPDEGASIAQMGAGLDHEIRLDLEIGPITIYILSWNMKP